MNIPQILIVADYKFLHAYMILPDGLPEIVEKIDYVNDGPTSAPLVGWGDGRNGYRAIADKISEILDCYQTDSWGLACPPTLTKHITQWLSTGQMSTLAAIRQMGVETVDVSTVCKIFDSTSKDYEAHKEHC